LAISSVSVETGERRVDAHGPAQDAVERKAGRRTFEALQAPAGIGATAVAGARDERTVFAVEALQLVLGRFAAAAGARADRATRRL
jgi:hypothetical protein